MGEDQHEEETKIIEGSKREEVEEAPIHIDQKKRKDKSQPMKRTNNITKPS